jgi:hypothetical protein
MATGYLTLLPQAALLPDGSASNLAAGLARVQGTETSPKKHYLVLDFDGAGAVELAWWTFVMPGHYASGGTLSLYWTLAGTSLAVKWQARVGAITPDDTDTPAEHAQAAAATVTTNVNTSESGRLTKSDITLTMDSAAANDLMFLTVLRDSADAADTSTVDARLIAAVFSYTIT